MWKLPIIIRSQVIRGYGQGKDLGTPTLNLDLASIPKEVEEGIYAAYMMQNGQKIPATVHYGPRPVFDQPVSFEVHVLDQTMDDPPAAVEVELIQYLRGVKNFPSVDDLKVQIEKDKDEARRALQDGI